MIEVKDLVKKYGETVAVDHLSFSLCDGGIHGFLGPNGAGKSTTMNIITGCLEATSGSVVINEKSIADAPIEAKRMIGYLPEIPPLYDNMTPFEYLVFVAEAKKVPYDKLYRNVNSVIELTHIEDVKSKLIKNLSKGYKQRVGIAQAMLGNPDIIILDEPTVGLDPKQITEIRDLIRRLGEIKTIIISSHILSEINELCDDVIIIAHGKLIAHDTIEALEQKLSKTHVLTISVRGKEDTIINAIKDVEGLHECTVTDVKGDVITMKLEFDSKLEIRDPVFKALAEANCPILRMDSESLTLEDIYLKLTDGAQKKETSGGRKRKLGRKGGKQ